MLYWVLTSKLSECSVYLHSTWAGLSESTTAVIGQNPKHCIKPSRCLLHYMNASPSVSQEELRELLSGTWFRNQER